MSVAVAIDIVLLLAASGCLLMTAGAMAVEAFGSGLFGARLRCVGLTFLSIMTGWYGFALLRGLGIYLAQ